MNIFNDVLRKTRNLTESNELTLFYIFGGITYGVIDIICDTSYFINEYKNGRFYKYKFVDGKIVSTVWDAIRFGVEYGRQERYGYDEARIGESALWPYALVKKIVPSIVYFFNRNAVVNKIESEDHHDFSDMGSLDENKTADEKNRKTENYENDELDN